MHWASSRPDPQALAALLRAYMVFSTSPRLTGGPTQAEDIERWIGPKIAKGVIAEPDAAPTAPAHPPG